MAETVRQSWWLVGFMECATTKSYCGAWWSCFQLDLRSTNGWGWLCLQNLSGIQSLLGCYPGASPLLALQGWIWQWCWQSVFAAGHCWAFLSCECNCWAWAARLKVNCISSPFPFPSTCLSPAARVCSSLGSGQSGGYCCHGPELPVGMVPP